LIIHRVDDKDNVATALRDVARGEKLRVGATELVAVEPIPYGHKIALDNIPSGSEVIKYGEPIGAATRSILAGEHVHVHNVVTLRGIRTVRKAT
jgi:hypothetical protein